jgi:hypothetical protein
MDWIPGYTLLHLGKSGTFCPSQLLVPPVFQINSADVTGRCCGITCICTQAAHPVPITWLPGGGGQGLQESSDPGCLVGG